MEPPKPFITYSPSEPSKQRLLSSLGLLDRLVFRQTRNGQWEEEQESNRHYEYGSQCASRFEAAMHKTQSLNDNRFCCDHRVNARAHEYVLF
jgi:hypothetical protein